MNSSNQDIETKTQSNTKTANQYDQLKYLITTGKFFEKPKNSPKFKTRKNDLHE